MKRKNIALDFIIDRLTNSIQNTISGDSFQTEISRLTNIDIKQINKKNGWQFDWKSELVDNKKRYISLPSSTMKLLFRA
jgi:hypothetical protein